MVLGGVKVRRKLTSDTFREHSTPRPLLNKKHSAASTADETTQPAPTTQQQIPARKCVKQTDTTGPHRTSNSEG